MIMKKGRFSKSEQAFIKQNFEKLSVQQIATELDRDPDSIGSYIVKTHGAISDKDIYDLKKRPFWRDLTQQFSEEELETVIYHWQRIISQFRDDVLPTEELQVLDAVKLEVLMNRALKQQQINMNDISMYEQMITDEKGRPIEDQDRDYLFNLERQIAVARAAFDSLSRDYRDLQTKKGSMLKDLKATREQRIKRLEDSKQTFIGWVRNLMSNSEVRQELGMKMEKMRMAMANEKARMSEYHTYEDKMVDQPFLTPDTVKDND